MEMFLIILAAVILATFVLVKMGVVRFKLSLQDGFSFEVGLKPSTLISLGNYLGVVIHGWRIKKSRTLTLLFQQTPHP